MVAALKCKGVPKVVSDRAKVINMDRFQGPQPKNISCTDNLTTQNAVTNLPFYVRGDPGSVFTFECRETFCAGKGSLIGVGL